MQYVMIWEKFISLHSNDLEECVDGTRMTCQRNLISACYSKKKWGGGTNCEKMWWGAINGEQK